MGPALWLFVLTVNLAPQTHVPKLASLPHASPTNVTFMSSFSHGRPPTLLSSRLPTHFPGPLWTPHTYTHSAPADTSPHLLLPRLSLSLQPLHPPHPYFPNLPPPLVHFIGWDLISSTSCLRELFQAPLFPVFALSGIHFMSIYSLVKYHKRVTLWEMWTAKKRMFTPLHPTKKGPLNAFCQLFPFGTKLTKITSKGGFLKKKKKCFIQQAHLKRHYRPQRMHTLLQQTINGAIIQTLDQGWLQHKVQGSRYEVKSNSTTCTFSVLGDTML